MLYNWRKYSLFYVYTIFTLFAGMNLLQVVMPTPVYAETESEDQQYQKAVDLFNHKHWEEAKKAFSDFLSTYPKSRWKIAVQLRLADLESDFSLAVDGYRAVLEQAQGSEWEADAAWGLALSLFALGQYQQALPYLIRIKSENGQRHAQALYLTGICHMALKQYAQARTYFEQVLQSYAQTDWAEKSLVGLADCAVVQNQPTEALASCDRYLRAYPEGDLTHMVLMQKSRALSSQGHEEEAKRLLQELVTRFTESFEAQKARGNLTTPQKQFCIQVGAFSKKEYAEKLVKSLRRKGYNAYVLAAGSGKEVYNQVRVGSYSTREFTQKIAEKLAKQEKLPFIILPYVKPDSQ